jgi:hypothetical protein
MSRCEIVLVRNLQDSSGCPCNNEATEECGDCGTALCGLHAESCDLCGASLCGGCFPGHTRQPHAKPSVPSHAPDFKRRIA